MKNILKTFIIFCILHSTFSIILAADRDLPGIDIISREERGADERLRLESYERFQSILQYRKSYKAEMEELKETDYDTYYQKYKADQESSYRSQMANDYLKQNFPDDIELHWTNYNYNGEKLRRPEYHKDDKSKIIIHHTASNNSELKNIDDVKEYLSGVYLYHTITHGRGDIGYNFIIDPFGNIYEGRSGGEGVVGAHAKRNNSPSIGISLIGNFEEQVPTKKAITALIDLSTVIAQKYKIDPNSSVDYHRDTDEAPYIESNPNYSVAGHTDAGYTACPGENLYALLPYIRREISENLNIPTLTSSQEIEHNHQHEEVKIENEAQSKKQKTKLTYEYFESIQNKIKPAISSIKSKYIKQNNISKSTNQIQKQTSSINKTQAGIYLKQDISVLLYDLTQNYNTYNLTCDGGCIFIFDKQKIEGSVGKIEIGKNISLNIDGINYITDRLVVYSNNDLITIENYNRESYVGIPRNTFNGALIFKQDDIKNLNGKESRQYVVINKLPFTQYLQGIAETNDTETSTKNEVMSLISKSYALFYMNPKNIHPNIPPKATYQAVDDPRIFQKYVGAGLKNTLTKRYKALDKTQDKIITYQDNIVILPYFSCSAGFTYSANEKRGRTDTPYLKSKFDIGICSDKEFAGHGVGLSGLGAERWAKLGRNYKDILQYYYPGIEIVNN